MTRLLVWFLLAAAPAAAQPPPPIAVELRPETAPYRYVFTLRAEREVDVVADRRLLSLELTPLAGRARAIRCRMPGAPSRVREGRVVRLSPSRPYEEWVDLREACWGRSLPGLRAGANVVARYGFARPGRDRWVVREGEARWHAVETRLTAAAAPPPAPEAADAPVEVRLVPADVATGSSLVFRVSLRARGDAVHVYSRPDAWSFRVRGPLGEVVCRIPGGGGEPPVDLYRRVTRRGAVTHALDAQVYCPADTFALDGIYEVRARVRLRHAGTEWGLRAVTGNFVSPYTPVRVRAGERGYVERVPQSGRGDG
ncbi:MAG: hypothetical protein IT378_20585 [Sandaracinaceae bacterium]|nr:hypothetical protein [Sandaracinaceae bacterium]